MLFKGVSSLKAIKSVFRKNCAFDNIKKKNAFKALKKKTVRVFF